MAFEDILFEVQLFWEQAPAAPIQNVLFQDTFFLFKTLMTAVSIVLLLAIAYVVFRLQGVARNTVSDMLSGATIEPDEASAPRGAFQSRWESTLSKLTSENESEWKLAVIEADKLLEEALKAAGFFGESVGDMLRRLDKAKLANLDAAWQAHKFRNNIVHEPKQSVTLAEVKDAMARFEAVLRELGVVD